MARELVLILLILLTLMLVVASSGGEGEGPDGPECLRKDNLLDCCKNLDEDLNPENCSDTDQIITQCKGGTDKCKVRKKL